LEKKEPPEGNRESWKKGNPGTQPLTLNQNPISGTPVKGVKFLTGVDAGPWRFCANKRKPCPEVWLEWN